MPASVVATTLITHGLAFWEHSKVDAAKTESRLSRITIRAAIVLGAIEMPGVLLALFFLFVFGLPPFDYPYSQALATILLLLTGSAWMLPAGLIACRNPISGTWVMLIGAFLSAFASLWLSSTHLVASALSKWWEHSLGFDVGSFIGLSSAFSGPLLLFGVVLYREHVYGHLLTRRQTAVLAGSTLLFLLVIVSLKGAHLTRQLLAMNAVERWGGRVTIEYVRDFSRWDSRGWYYHQRFFVERVEVDLRNANLTDDNLAVLRELGSVTYLLLAATNVGDKSLLHLQPLSELEFVELRRTEVTDAGLEHLQTFPKLKAVDLYHTNTTQEGRQHLRDAMPSCDVIP